MPAWSSSLNPEINAENFISLPSLRLVRNCRNVPATSIQESFEESGTHKLCESDTKSVQRTFVKTKNRRREVWNSLLGYRRNIIAMRFKRRILHCRHEQISSSRSAFAVLAIADLVKDEEQINLKLIVRCQRKTLGR